MNIEKCHFAHLEILLLGFRISPYGRTLDRSRLVNVTDWSRPTTAKQVQHYLGFSNYFREHIPLMSHVTAPLDAIRFAPDVPAAWTSACDDAFTRLKKLLVSAIPLAFPDFSRMFYVATDASNTGLGAVLYQSDDSEDTCIANYRWISFQTRALSSSE
ncbi:MAG: ribonuclease H family protein [Nitrososphaerales archaeon]